MKKLFIVLGMFAALSSQSFAGTVGESSTDCIKNQSTQARGAKKVQESEVRSEEVKVKKQKES
ncbi:hypothetical protein [Halobacteriovorax sp. HLS]|uniref:hypothetical protein n=1 Tax=Halobacteriovorax sp. HLS TaxID=2234000 RepID=UPI000FD6E8D9|nr:hypothetical protein [Halobacteriovorax sp. HLS]